MAEMKISNTLVNDTQEGILAYSNQIKDTTQNKFLNLINSELYERTSQNVIGTNEDTTDDITIKGTRKLAYAVLGQLEEDLSNTAYQIVGNVEDAEYVPTLYGTRNLSYRILGQLELDEFSISDLLTRALTKNHLGTVQTTPITGTLYGVAGLDSTGKVPSEQLPSYVDDIIEVKGCFAKVDTGDLFIPVLSDEITFDRSKWSPSNWNFENIVAPSGASSSDLFLDFYSTEATSSSQVPQVYQGNGDNFNTHWEAEKGKIYVVTNLNNRTFRYSGTKLVEIVASPGTTDDITEGNTNKFFHAELALNALASSLAAKVDIPLEHTTNHVPKFDSNGNIVDSGYTIDNLKGTDKSGHYTPVYRDESKSKANPNEDNHISVNTSTDPSGAIYGVKYLNVDEKGHVLDIEGRAITVGDVLGAGTYSKPLTGIPAEHLSSEVLSALIPNSGLPIGSLADFIECLNTACATALGGTFSFSASPDPAESGMKKYVFTFNSSNT